MAREVVVVPEPPERGMRKDEVLGSFTPESFECLDGGGAMSRMMSGVHPLRRLQEMPPDLTGKIGQAAVALAHHENDRLRRNRAVDQRPHSAYQLFVMQPPQIVTDG